MDIFSHILYGFQVALIPVNVLACFAGAVMGTLVGVLPGLGPVATMSMLLPITLKMSPVTAVIMLAGIYYGAQYGGSITSILVNVPGEATTVVTCLDGYKMAQKGRAGPALGISAIGSFIGGTLSLIGVMLLAAPIASFALKFGPPEYFALCFLALTVVTSLAAKSTLKGFVTAMLGMLVGTVGMDLGTGLPRFTFGIQTLADGVGLIPVIMGLFGIGEILLNVEKLINLNVGDTKIGKIWPTVKDWIDSRWAILRGTVIGFILGLIPGSGAIISPFVSYAVEKKISKHPEKFGTGIIEGVAGPETANNASSQASFIPLLSLGIPSNVVTAVLLGALMIYGVEPGPLLVANRPDMFWGVITSMYLGNVMLVILNMPLIGLWVQILRIPYRLLMPLILLFCLIGVYSINGNVVEIWIMALFGLIGYLMNHYGYEPAPFVMGLVLSPIVEDSFRQSLVLSEGSFLIFFTRPLSGVLMFIAIAVLASYCVPLFKRNIEVIKENVTD
ncbi:MAG: tripartite tricarboxylate transporter permease [Deltaproteobacteria bacterium]|nr:tripartite tricarboxylate transporter permease [Deltaproteobacteria bacterium]